MEAEIRAILTAAVSDAGAEPGPSLPTLLETPPAVLITES
jgi:plasmid stability protein